MAELKIAYDDYDEQPNITSAQFRASQPIYNIHQHACRRHVPGAHLAAR